MPFTLAHPIAALPLWWGSQRRLDLTALMIGATIPDISYFIALQPVANIGHQFSGIFLEGIPSAFALLLIGKYVLWQPVMQLLPRAIAQRFPRRCPYRILPVSRLLMITLSIALGAATHIVWDNFTHYRGWGVNRIGLLSHEVLNLPIYKWLQHSGGLIGFALILLFAYQAFRTLESRYQHSTSSLKTLPISWKVFAGGAISSITILTIFTALKLASGITDSVIAIVIGTISGSFIGLCFYALCFWLPVFINMTASNKR